MKNEHLEAIKAHCKLRGWAIHSIYPGNACICVDIIGRACTINMYFIFNNEDKIIDIQID